MEDRNHRTWQPASDPDSGTISASLIFGLAIVAVGVLFLLDNFGVPVGNVWGYWPVILIAIGLAKVVDSRDTAGRTGGAIILLVGLVFMADKIHLPFLRQSQSLGPVAGGDHRMVGFMMLWGALEGKERCRCRR
jgi:hypothetical protein